mgnify:CR=1 FL=1
MAGLAAASPPAFNAVEQHASIILEHGDEGGVERNGRDTYDHQDHL